MNPDKCAEIREAHQIVTEMIGEYKAVMDGGRKLLSLVFPHAGIPRIG